VNLETVGSGHKVTSGGDTLVTHARYERQLVVTLPLVLTLSCFYRDT